MANEESRNPLPHLFVGTWKVVKQAVDGALESVSGVRISIEESGQYNLTTDPDEREFQLEFDGEDGTLRTIGDPTVDLCISYWRNPSYDVIFGAEQDGKGVWSARRASKNSRPIEMEKPKLPKIETEGPFDRPWSIVNKEGAHAARDVVILSRLCAPGIQNLELDLYGLFHLDSTLNEELDWRSLQLYDVLYSDEHDRSFNSLFNVRSVHYWANKPDDPAADRLFATFDNRLSVAKLSLSPQPVPLVKANLGRLMPFERAHALVDTIQKVIRKIEPELNPETTDAERAALISNAVTATADDGDDPDVGVWVGTPNP